MKCFRRLVCFAMAVSMALCLVGCNSFEENAYKTIKSCAVVYDAAMQAAADHYAEISDSEEQAAFKSTVLRYAEPIQASLLTAKEAVKAYSRAYAAYESAKEASSNATNDSTLAELLAEANAAKEAAQAALNSLSTNMDAFQSAIKTIIALF